MVNQFTCYWQFRKENIIEYTAQKQGIRTKTEEPSASDEWLQEFLFGNCDDLNENVP